MSRFEGMGDYTINANHGIDPDDDLGEPLFPLVRALEAMPETWCTNLATV